MAHKGARDDLTAKYVRSILDYEPETGVLRWKVSMPPRGRIGAVAGFKRKSGHIALGIHGAEYYVHRLIWLIVTGEWPKQEIDHVNGNMSDNRWHNLREATSTQNIYNRTAKNPHGIKGVQWRPELGEAGKWVAKITIRRKQMYLGMFDTADEARDAYQAAAHEHYGGFARHN